MAESSVQTRRWNAFVCPECRNVFRVPGNHDGRGVVCPTCRRMLRLPAKDESTPSLVMPKQEEKKRESSRARRERRSAEIFDETFSRKEKDDPMLFRIVMAGAATLVIVLLAGLFWPRNGGQADEGGDNALLPSELIELPDPEPDGLTIDTLSPDVVGKQLLPVIQEFLDATTLKEASVVCRRPTRTLQRMKGFHGDRYYAPGLRQILTNKPMTREEDWAMLEVEDKSFRQRPIALVFEDSRWKIDWESWAGWSEMDLATLRKEKPTEPTLVRVRVEPTDYYNFDFTDDSKWSSYRMLDPDQLETVYGYVPSLGELDLRLKPNADEKGARFSLQVRFPENSTADNQLIIDEIVSKGWIVKEETP